MSDPAYLYDGVRISPREASIMDLAATSRLPPSDPRAIKIRALAESIDRAVIKFKMWKWSHE